jgi:uroporphyrinogen decarboxylase
MDMAEVKQKYGDRVCIMGNIDCGELLCHSTEQEVERAVDECIQAGASGGGLIVSSSNSIHSGVKPQNYAAMIEAVHKYGKYPD